MKAPSACSSYLGNKVSLVHELELQRDLAGDSTIRSVAVHELELQSDLAGDSTISTLGKYVLAG